MSPELDAPNGAEAAATPSSSISTPKLTRHNSLVKCTDQQPQAVFLLEDILICILRRLDVRDVARFRCVCKKWEDLTSNPKFVDSLLIPVSNLPMILTKHTRYSLPFAKTTELCVDRWWQIETSVRIVGSSRYIYNGRYSDDGHQSTLNGFIFRRIDDSLPYEIIVRNPITAQQVTIFLHKQSLPNYCVEGADILGIFLHPIRRDHYCTLWVIKAEFDCPTQYKMLNLEADDQPITSWRNVGKLWSHSWISDCSVICLDGFMYWMVYHRHNKHEPGVELIIAFNMKTEDFAEMSLPSTYNHIPFKSNLVNADGFLSLVQVVVDEVITVKTWTLKDPKRRFWIASQHVLWQVKPPPKPWQVQEHLSKHHFLLLYKGPRAVAIVKSELVIVGEVGINDGSKGLFVCNLECGTIRELRYSHDVGFDVGFWAHHPSIASLKHCQPVIHITNSQD